MMLLIRGSAGMLAWAFGFGLLYALHGAGCANGWQDVSLLGGSLFRWTLVAVWVSIGCCGGVIVRWAWTSPAGFERKLAVASGVAGLVGTVVTGSPVAFASTCL